MPIPLTMWLPAHSVGEPSSALTMWLRQPIHQAGLPPGALG